MIGISESEIEEIALSWLEDLGYAVEYGPEISSDGSKPERASYEEIVINGRLRRALATLNSGLSADALEDAFRQLMRPHGATLEARNRSMHRMLIDGVTVENRRPDGTIGGAQVQVIDFNVAENNDWLAVNQFTVTEDQHTRRPDIVLFVNGLPIVVIELKNAADEKATIWTAFKQLQTYMSEIPSLFTFNELLIVSDGVEARMGSLTAGREWFKSWRTVSGDDLADVLQPELQVMIEGVFEKRRLLDLIRDFIVFEDLGTGVLAKKIAGYHQFHAVLVAIEETLRAAKTPQEGEKGERRGRFEAGRQSGGEPGDRRVGVVWHTQGSGKSLTMAFYAGRLIREPAMANPTIVVLTDRNDLDGQLFGMFSLSHDPASSTPRASREPG